MHYCSCFEREELYSVRLPVQIFKASVGKRSPSASVTFRLLPACTVHCWSPSLQLPLTVHLACLVGEWVYCMMSLFLSDKCGNSLLLCAFTTKLRYLPTDSTSGKLISTSLSSRHFLLSISFFTMCWLLFYNQNYPLFVTINMKLISTCNCSPDNDKTKSCIQIRMSSSAEISVGELCSINLKETFMQ